MAPRLRSASALHNVLPEEALRVIMLALPADARARAACVCRAWRAFLADVSLWQVLDLTPAGGVVAERVTENLVRGAVARAAGQLRSFSFEHKPDVMMVNESLTDMIVSNGAELQTVTLSRRWLAPEWIAAICAAAPRLQVFNTSVSSSCAELLPMARNNPPYGPLRLSGLRLWNLEGAAATDLLALAASLASHESLKSLFLVSVSFAYGLNALLDAASERRVRHLLLECCDLNAESSSALARLLRRGTLITLKVIACSGFPQAQDASWPVLCAALRSCRTLTHLTLSSELPGGADERTVTELIDAVASLPALSELELNLGEVHDTLAFGRALGALLAVNRPSFRTLNVDECLLGDDRTAPLLDSLAANTHLRRLQCDEDDLSEEFKRARLVPALAALAARAALDA
jgi:hypothetical protein